MKLSYYGYFIENKGNKNRYLHDLLPFLNTFCAVDNPDYKNKFLSATDEHVYLFKKTPNIFLFVMTKSHEIIKKIDTKKIDVDEIYSQLGSNDKLGFASYVFFKDCYYGIASTVQGPRNKSFNIFLNSIIQSLGIKLYEFQSFALLHQASSSEVLELPFIGKTIVQVGEGNLFFDHLKGFLGGKVEDIDSFVIEIKPKRRKSINDSFAKLNSKINDQGLLKYIVRAKEYEEEALEDFYISCQGGVCDIIHGKDDSNICKEMLTKVDNNTTLSSKVKEIKDDKKFITEAIPAFSGFSKLSAWTNYLANI